LALKV
jgi:hypothetical protein